MRTRITQLLGIRHPILLPGMSWISTPELVAAVSNAGGCGILATGPLTAKQTRESIRKIRSLTDKPFGIGATLLMPGATDNAEVALEEEVPLINFSLGKGDWIVERVQKYGGKTLCTVVSEKHAKSAEAIGVDALMVTGHEAAAHGGEVTSLCLIPAIAAKTNLPIVAAGGFANGQGLMAAMSLGADAIAMGSRFATTQESPLAQTTKDAVVERSEADTIYSKNFDGLYARVMKTPAAIKATKSPTNPLVAAYNSFSAAQDFGIPLWKVIPGLLTQWDKMYMLSQFGGAMGAIQAAQEGDLDNGVQFIGQSQGLITDQPTVDELVQRVIAEAEAAHALNHDRFLEGEEKARAAA
eukprot:CAMPEP_0118862682 /NCGR_PEP_ID=MMETSP1163-20130328/7802_1 /TAXON_ID=124430 /ORGANISM="Phaeomonas parva, Strain CCMP2877" /LENGTH=353 /DNA_ID=CAMNT_0006796605 /DNA_START=74 /DNA_END=1135 /DNA_ORIENTATION=+